MQALGAPDCLLALSAYAIKSEKDFSFMGGFLFVGIWSAFLAVWQAFFFNNAGFISGCFLQCLCC